MLPMFSFLITRYEYEYRLGLVKIVRKVGVAARAFLSLKVSYHHYPAKQAKACIERISFSKNYLEATVCSGASTTNYLAAFLQFLLPPLFSPPSSCAMMPLPTKPRSKPIMISPLATGCWTWQISDSCTRSSQHPDRKGQVARTSHLSCSIVLRETKPPSES